MKPAEQSVDALIRSLYRGSSEVPFARFKDWALEQLAGLLRFDAAWWGKASFEPRPVWVPPRPRCATRSPRSGASSGCTTGWN